MDDKTALYRHWDADGNLLYVGISLSAIHRLAQHNQKSHWSETIASVTIENFDSRQAALAAEEVAIKAEKPLHNVIHANDNRQEVARRGRKPKTDPSRAIPLPDLMDFIAWSTDRHGTGEADTYSGIVFHTLDDFWAYGRFPKAHRPSEEYIREAIEALVLDGTFILHNGRAHPSRIMAGQYHFNPDGGIIDAPFFPEDIAKVA